MALWRTSVRVDYAAPGGPGYCTFHYRDDGIPGDAPGDLQTASNALSEAFLAIAPVVTSTTVWNGLGIWQEVDGPREIDTGFVSRAGTLSAQNLLPGNCNIVVGWRTEDRSRSGRGRTFLPGFPTSASVDGTPTPAVMAAARAFGQELVDFNTGVANGAFVVYSRTQGIARDITSYAVRDIWASLRSRRD